MRKSINSLFAAAILVVAFASCKKSSSTAAFEHSTMKPWFDNYCASCHASGKANASNWKYDATDYDNSIKGKISKIYSTVYTNKSMPQGSTVSTTDMAAFKSWYDAGYPAK